VFANQDPLRLVLNTAALGVNGWWPTTVEASVGDRSSCPILWLFSFSLSVGRCHRPLLKSALARQLSRLAVVPGRCCPLPAFCSPLLPLVAEPAAAVWPGLCVLTSGGRTTWPKQWARLAADTCWSLSRRAIPAHPPESGFDQGRG